MSRGSDSWSFVSRLARNCRVHDSAISILQRERFLQYLENLGGSPGIDVSQLANDARAVDGAQLIEHDLAILAFEPAWHSGRINHALGSHGRDDDRAEMGIHLVRRND